MSVGFMIFAVCFGLFVLVPITAILAENVKKGGGSSGRRDRGVLEDRIGKLEGELAAQRHQMEELKELVHVNIIKMEDQRELHQRLGPPGE